MEQREHRAAKAEMHAEEAPICRNHFCRFERPRLEAEIRRLTDWLEFADLFGSELLHGGTVRGIIKAALKGDDPEADLDRIIAEGRPESLGPSARDPFADSTREKG